MEINKIYNPWQMASKCWMCYQCEVCKMTLNGNSLKKIFHNLKWFQMAVFNNQNYIANSCDSKTTQLPEAFVLFIPNFFFFLIEINWFYDDIIIIVACHIRYLLKKKYHFLWQQQMWRWNIAKQEDFNGRQPQSIWSEKKWKKLKHTIFVSHVNKHQQLKHF